MHYYLFFFLVALSHIQDAVPLFCSSKGITALTNTYTELVSKSVDRIEATADELEKSKLRILDSTKKFEDALAAAADEINARELQVTDCLNVERIDLVPSVILSEINKCDLEFKKQADPLSTVVEKTIEAIKACAADPNQVCDDIKRCGRALMVDFKKSAKLSVKQIENSYKACAKKVTKYVDAEIKNVKASVNQCFGAA